ncbi:hypothetical protein KCU67_g832, partial [Aureobasidium melanogenum]
MVSRSALIAASAVLFMYGARGLAASTPVVSSDLISTTPSASSIVPIAGVPHHVNIAVNDFYACNGPNNANHHQGSSCKHVNGASDHDKTFTGTCQYRGSTLRCV